MQLSERRVQQPRRRATWVAFLGVFEGCAVHSPPVQVG